MPILQERGTASVNKFEVADFGQTTEVFLDLTIDDKEAWEVSHLTTKNKD